METSSLNYIDAEIVGISIALTKKESFYIPVAHENNQSYKQLPLKFILENFKDILESN